MRMGISGIQMFALYLVTNLVNGKRYIGQTTQRNPNRRWTQHTGESLCGRGKQPIHAAIRKYGPENFSFEVLTTFSSQEALNLAEVVAIEGRGTLAPQGYNIKAGGGNSPTAESTKEKLRLVSVGRNISDAVKAKLRVANLGVRRSDETREKIRLAQNRPEVRAKKSVSQTTAMSRPGVKEKISVAVRAVVNRPEVRAKWAAANKGKTVSEEQKLKISATLKRVKDTPEWRAKASAQMKVVWTERKAISQAH